MEDFESRYQDSGFQPCCREHSRFYVKLSLLPFLLKTKNEFLKPLPNKASGF